ncbi:hypothetical protein ACWDRB_39270 [Nonomuraea sp. NPDC003707]
MIETTAWVLHRGPDDAIAGGVAGELRMETLQLPDPVGDEVVAEPLYGCWEANMSHALERSPVDICRQRGEDRIVLGNAGVVLVTDVGPDAVRVKPGDICMVVCAGRTDPHGYIELVHGYDMPGSVGVLTQRMTVSERLLQPVPPADTDLRQWATYARYWTAWDNWQVARTCWSSQVTPSEQPDALVFGWGGGVTFAQLTLAQREGFRVAMTASTPERLEMLARAGITPVDRRNFPDLAYDSARYRSDPDYRERYLASESTFLATIAELSDGRGVAVFSDNIGGPLTRAAFKALGRQGVLTTAGWKHGMRISSVRAIECITRHIHIHTHACRVTEIPRVVAYQERTGWLPDLTGDPIYDFEDIPQLAKDYAAGDVTSYFPIFRVNAD